MDCYIKKNIAKPETVVFRKFHMNKILQKGGNVISTLTANQLTDLVIYFVQIFWAYITVVEIIEKITLARFSEVYLYLEYICLLIDDRIVWIVKKGNQVEFIGNTVATDKSNKEIDQSHL